MEEKIVKEVLKSLFLEEAQFLFETWSHAEEIDAAIENIYDKISEVAPQTKEEVVVEGRIYIRHNEIPITLFDIDINLCFYMYIAKDEVAAKYMVENCYARNGVNEEENEMIVTIYTINGNLMETISNKNIAHELKHLLQISKALNKNINYTALTNVFYEYVSNVLTEPEKYNQDIVKIAWLCYYSNPHEQDAFMEEYYTDLCYLRQYVGSKETETSMRLADYRNLIQWFDENKELPEIQKIIKSYKVYGIRPKTLEIMFKKGYGRFERKMKNIEKHFQDKVKYLKERHYHGTILPKTGSIKTIKLF